jgi:RHS repeat-associated protein
LPLESPSVLPAYKLGRVLATDAGGGATMSAPLTVNVVGNTAPIITWKTPANGASLVGPTNITLSAFANDSDGTIPGSVRFYVNGNYLMDSGWWGRQADGSYDNTWSNVQPGTYVLTASVADNQGRVTTSAPITITVTGRNAPTIRWQNPTASHTYSTSDQIQLSVYADDAYSTTGANVSQINFYANGALMAFNNVAYWGRFGDGSYGHQFSNMSGMAPGTYVLTAQVIDNAGLSATTPPITVTITGPKPPTVSITAPTSPATYAGPANITLLANASSDNSKTLAAVKFYSGESLIATATQTSGTVTGGAYVTNWANVSPGSYSVTAEATDSQGFTTASSPVAITVTGTPAPAISLTAPGPNGIYTAPATINLAATASSQNAGVSQVQFFTGASLISTATLSTGNASSGSYVSNPVTNLPAGTYTITAVATDSNGATATSAPAIITVNPAQAGAGQMYFISDDHLDTPRLIQDQNQQAVWTWSNDEPFGDSTPNSNPNGAGAFTFNPRFPGQYADDETGTSYNYFRDFTASLGRYMKADPVGIQGGLSVYSYVYSNPIRLRDRRGLDPFECASGGPCEESDEIPSECFDRPEIPCTPPAAATWNAIASQYCSCEDKYKISFACMRGSIDLTSKTENKDGGWKISWIGVGQTKKVPTGKAQMQTTCKCVTPINDILGGWYLGVKGTAGAGIGPYGIEATGTVQVFPPGLGASWSTGSSSGGFPLSGGGSAQIGIGR